MKIWTCGSSPRSGSRNAWTCIKNVNGVSHLRNFWNFFGAIQMISRRDWWPWTKPGYITMTRRQSNNQWIGGKNPVENFSPRFFGIKTASSSLIIFQMAKLSTRSITNLCWCNWRTRLMENAVEKWPKGSCSCTTMPGSIGTGNQEETGLPGLPVSWSPTLCSGSDPVGLPPVPCTMPQLTSHLQPRINWPTWATSVLITHPILRIWPPRTTTCSLDWKKQLKGRHRPTRRSLLPWRPGWTDNLLNFFLSGL